jgi:hypothetical protein
MAGGILIWATGKVPCEGGYYCGNQDQTFQHDVELVQQKPLATAIFSLYSNSRGQAMANVLNMDKQIMVIGALAEGASIRSIERMTGVHRDTHRESVPVKETFNGETVWEGIVEVFDLTGHPKANKAYAWSQDADNPDKPTYHVTMLHIPPAVSPEKAVRAALIQEFRNATV